MMPWKSGKVLVWDATCPDIFPPSYSELLSGESSAITDRVESVKLYKYANIRCIHHFVPVGIETSGMFDREAMIFSRSW